MEVKSGVKLLLLVLCCGFISVRGTSFSQDMSDDMPHHEVEHWGQRIGTHLYHLLDTVVGYSDIDENYKRMGATISPNDGLPLVKQMADDVSNMMKHKVQSVMRIMNVAEEVSQDTSYLQDSWEGYYNSKIVNQGNEYLETIKDRYDDKVTHFYGSRFDEKFSKLSLNKNNHFDGFQITLNESTVHVPTNVFEGGPGVIKAIRWSEALEKTFASNYEHDPTLSWQYFGSSTGFLRQYPGSQWEMDAQDPDLYDARLRSWYIQAANTPKDMVILLDISGSMTGLRKEIAKHVVMNILDTLNENDFVNILIFNDTTTTLVPCFNDTLVQANLENIGEFKRALGNISTTNIANFSQALKQGFKLLQKHNKMGHGAQCNQAIMLVTDGAPLTYEEIFQEFNWPQLQIRVFTYLIGRGIQDSKSLRWMACSNKGYFVHVTTPSEVREQVLKYIPVIARPMVMYRDKHPIVWTGVYADIADPKQTAWLWELRERERQRTRTINYRKLRNCAEGANYKPCVDKSKKEIEIYLKYGDFLTGREVQQKEAENARQIRGRRHYPGSKYGYKLLTTVSVPVLNRTQKEERVADLLGVAGTDVPIREIEKLVPPYKLGVNGYSYMVNKNGHILYHPDLRPTFQDILKPNYNSVDLFEVELTDFINETMQNRSNLFNLRRDMIEQRESVVDMKTRFHMDGMRRIQIRDHKYSTTNISGTPFSLGISLPMFYGRYKVNGQIELSLVMSENVDFNVTDYFSSGNWSLHPDWVYCEYKYDQGVDRTAEQLMMHFLKKAQMPGWKWRSTRSRPPPQSAQSPHHQGHHDEHDYYCDKTLVQSLLFDAKATSALDNNKTDKFHDGNRQKGSHKSYGITTAFVATRSGFTRWKDLNDDYHNPDNLHFMEKNSNAIDQNWYKRAVDYYNEDEEAYVYSVPFDAATRHPSQVLVTASRAIFIKQNKFQLAPAAVVGINIRLDKFLEFFTNETYNCHAYSRGSECKQNRTCQSDSLDCYLLDDSGFIVGSEKSDEIGKFFGMIEGTIMESLVQSEVYNRIRIYDYQAVCLDTATDGNFASILMTPVQVAKWVINWMTSNFMWLLIKTQLYHLWDENTAWAYDQEINNVYLENNNIVTDYDTGVKGIPIDMTEEQLRYMNDEESFPEVELAYIQKTRPRPCDKEVDLYKLNNSKLKDGDRFKPVKGKLSNCHADGCGRPFSVQKVIKTNLVLIVVHNLCPCESRTVEIVHKEVSYTQQQYCGRLLAKHFRERPAECFQYHPDEGTINDCGGCSRLDVPFGLLAVLLIICIVTKSIYQPT